MKKAERERLFLSAEQFRSVFEFSPIGISITSLNGQMITNEAFLKIIGYSVEELAGLKWQEITHPDDVENDISKSNEVISGEKEHVNWIKRYIHKDGHTVWVDISIRLRSDPRSNTRYFITTVNDITKRRESEILLRKLNRTYALLSEINKTIIRTHTPQELYDAVCNIAVSIGGFRMAWVGLVDRSTNQVLPVASAGEKGDYIERLHVVIDETDRGKGPTATALRTGKHCVSNDIASDPRMSPWMADALAMGYKASAVFPFIVGNEVKGSLSIYAKEMHFFDDEELALLDEMAANISFAMQYAEEEEQKKRIEKELLIAKYKAEQSDRLKSAFLANMSHEIRTPMNAIVGFSALLSDPDLTPKERQHFTEIIQSRSDDLMHLINDLLDISRIESGNATVMKTEVSLNDLLDETESVFLQKLERINNLELSLKAEKKIPANLAIIITDGFILKQVFSNLIDNAIKFTETGIIRFGYQLPSEGFITFYVSDTGIGIAPENHKLIFEHFRQAASDNTQKIYGGTGLGLSICKGSIALLGGEIWLDSFPGKGSTFYFKVPHEPAKGAPQNTQSGFKSTQTDGRYNWSGKKLLLVEDEASNMEFLQILLEPTGAELFKVYSGKELRARYNDLSSFDMVLLDVRLPDASGWDLAREIKALCHKLPVVSQTAFAMSSDRQKSKDVGCDGYISKPIRKSELFNIISELIF